MLQMTAEKNVIDFSFLAYGIEVELLNSRQRIRIEFAKTFATCRRICDRIGPQQASPIGEVVFDKRSHLAGRQVGDFVWIGRRRPVGLVSSLSLRRDAKCACRAQDKNGKNRDERG